MADDDNGGKPSREISTIQFPYYDLDDAIDIARAMHAAGGVPLDRDQLGVAINLSPTGGNFSVKVSAARMFGVIESPQGRFQLTELGFDILDPAREKAARARAFLNVELYRKAYETFKGRPLPPRPLGLEQAFVQLGVAPKQKDKARQVFDRSARSAGFFPNAAEDRLVMPIVAEGPAGAPTTSEESVQVQAPQAAATAAVQASSGGPAFMDWLLGELPPPKSDWTKAEQADWLQAVAQAFRVVYKSDPGETITVAVKSTGA